MIRFDELPPEVMQAMCTPMHQIVSPTLLPSSSSSQPPTMSGSLYLGSLAAVMDTPMLRSHNITHIIQVLDAPWNPLSEKDGFSLYKIEIMDEKNVDIRPYFEGASSQIERALRSGRSVLVHCQQGVSRSASIVIAYLIRYHNMSYDAATSLVRHKRACIKPNSGFVNALREWESGWKGVGSGVGNRPGVSRRFTY